MLTEVVSEYKVLCMPVADIIDQTGYKVDFVRQKLGYSRPRLV